jgi:hypothetical protein
LYKQKLSVKKKKKEKEKETEYSHEPKIPRDERKWNKRTAQFYI